jgi:hypothetical protein
MSDNVPITAGSGTSIASDDVGGVHYQKVKLDLGGDGASAPVSASVPVSGDTAHDVADAGNPIKVGGLAKSRATVPADVTNNDRVAAWYDPTGAQVMVGMEGPRQDATWTNGTALNTAVTIDCSKMSHVMVFYDAPTTGTITAGAFVFECSWDGGTRWELISGSCYDFTMTGFDLTSATQAALIGDWTLPNGWRIPCQGFDKVRVRVSTAITGTTAASSGTVRITSAGTLPSFTISMRSTTAGHGGGHEVVRQGDPTRLHVTTYGKTNNLNGTITGSGTLVFDLNGIQSNPVLQVANSGTAWTGTILFEQSIDNIDWTPAVGFDLVTYAGNGVPFTTVNGTWLMTLTSGQRYLRVRGNTVTNIADITFNGTAAQPSHLFTFTGGDKAHDAPDLSTFPLKIGARAVSFGANPTGVADSDRTALYATRAGQLLVLGGHPNILTLEAAYTGAQTNAAIITVSAGSKIVVTQIQVLCANANTAFPQCRVGFHATTTPTTTGVILTHPGIPAGGGVSRGDGSGILGVGADGDDLRITCDAPTGGSLRVLVSYFIIEG